MKFFNLPDLGEGIPEADIVEWHIQEGDHVIEDQIIVSVETAKAIVEVPSPVTAEVVKLCGQVGDTILTGAPLVEFVSNNIDSGTVVGSLETGMSTQSDDEPFFIGTPPSGNASNHPSAKNSITDLAERLGVDLSSQAQTRQIQSQHYSLENPEPLKGVRKHMANTMAQSHAQVVPVTLFDDADINHWPKDEDITVRLIQAIAVACKTEPALNAWFDGSSMSREMFDSIHVGLAVDSKDGLFVPVIRSAETLGAKEIRNTINQLRAAVKERSLPTSEMAGATIILSNFGVYAGKYATPIVVPPMVCILGVGQLRGQIVSHDGEVANHNILPLSLTFDHRAVTGGEATRFLKSVLMALQK